MADRVTDVAAVLVKYGIERPVAEECARALLLPALEKRPEHKEVVHWVGRFFHDNITDPAVEENLSRELQAALGLERNSRNCEERQR